MSNIKALITELRAIGTAQESLRYCDYWSDELPNMDRDKNYPALFIDRAIQTTSFDALTQRATYRIAFTFADLFHRDNEINVEVNETAQLSLEAIAVAYFRQYLTRRKTITDNYKKWSDPVFSSGGYQFNVYDERLLTLRLVYDFVVFLDCPTDEFNFPSD